MATQQCPCGYFGDAGRECTCSRGTVDNYQKRISGPLLDRIDIHVEVPRVDYEKLAGRERGETSAAVRARVEAARALQAERYRGSALFTNADMGPAEVRQHCELDEGCRGLIKAAMRQMHLSARGYHRVLKLARTIADLAGNEAIAMPHLAEALQYRRKEGE